MSPSQDDQFAAISVFAAATRPKIFFIFLPSPPAPPPPSSSSIPVLPLLEFLLYRFVTHEPSPSRGGGGGEDMKEDARSTAVRVVCLIYLARESVLFIGTQFSILYTSQISVAHRRHRGLGFRV